MRLSWNNPPPGSSPPFPESDQPLPSPSPPPPLPHTAPVPPLDAVFPIKCWVICRAACSLLAPPWWPRLTCAWPTASTTGTSWCMHSRGQVCVWGAFIRSHLVCTRLIGTPSVLLTLHLSLMHAPPPQPRPVHTRTPHPTHSLYQVHTSPLRTTALPPWSRCTQTCCTTPTSLGRTSCT